MPCLPAVSFSLCSGDSSQSVRSSALAVNVVNSIQMKVFGECYIFLNMSEHSKSASKRVIQVVCQSAVGGSFSSSVSQTLRQPEKQPVVQRVGQAEQWLAVRASQS